MCTSMILSNRMAVLKRQIPSFIIKTILQDAFPLDSVINWILLGWPEGVPLDPASGTVFTPVGVEEFPCLDSDFLFPEGVVSMPDGVLAPFALIESVLALFSEYLWFCSATTGEVASLVVSRIRLRSPLLVSVSMIITGSSDWNRKLAWKHKHSLILYKQELVLFAFLLALRPIAVYCPPMGLSRGTIHLLMFEQSVYI